MNRTEAARLLNVAEATLVRWVRQGLLSCGNGQGEHFERSELERWARQRGLPLGVAPRPRPPAAEDLLTSAVVRGAVTAGVRPATASEAIEIAVGAVPGLAEESRRRLLGDVLDRERMASTALGHGVAIPHPRQPPGTLVDQALVSVVFPDVPLDWAALDGQPVHAVVLLLSPSAPVHLQILSRVAHGLRSGELPSLLRRRPGKPELLKQLRRLRRAD